MGSISEDAAKHPDADAENKKNVTAVESGSMPSADDADLMRLTGHKPVLERNFSLLSLLAFSFMVVDSWLGITSALAAGISSGGTVLLVYGTIAVSLFTMAVAMSLAEIAGAYPTSGGQYHWTAELAPQGYGPMLSWFCGYFNTIGWCVVSASVTIITGQFIMAMTILYNPGVEYQRWHGFLIYQFFAIVFTAVNIFGRKAGPLINKFGFAFCITSFLAINITLLATTSDKNSAKWVFTNFVNKTGWKTDGIAFIVGLTNPAFSYGGLDNGVHMAEEIRGARRSLPLILVSTVAIGFVTMFLTALSMSFCILDLEAVINTPTGVPVLEIFFQATESKAASVFLLFLMLYLIAACAVCSLQTANRLMWAFARDEALPFSNQLKQIHPKWKVPVKSALLCWLVMAVLGCIYVASSTAFNALVGCNVLLANISFAFPISLMLFRRKHMKPTTFPLGNILGPILNALALGWIIFMVTFFNFPFTMPAEPSNMNYSCVIISAVAVISGGWWVIRGRKTYKGPKMDVGIDAAFLTQLAQTTADADAKASKAEQD